MKKYNKLIGNYGEDIAVKFLINSGYKIIHKNFKCKLGEIDIIATIDNIIVFIEVKSRYSSLFGGAEEAISLQKRYKIIKIATYYLTIKKISGFLVRFDSIEINFSKVNSTYEINHKVDAFRPNY
ncbi:YraN family protein [Clostridium massiliamazoniense]|uniref:YraN family protein n=1 Tax=Clostridium massiliamazoniense TaxID=1347366 RepID=UPI0006D825BD|nr:YraN family protein [Clostridium massiliamazoniense]